MMSSGTSLAFNCFDHNMCQTYYCQIQGRPKAYKRVTSGSTKSYIYPAYGLRTSSSIVFQRSPFGLPRHTALGVSARGLAQYTLSIQVTGADIFFAVYFSLNRHLLIT